MLAALLTASVNRRSLPVAAVKKAAARVDSRIHTERPTRSNAHVQARFSMVGRQRGAERLAGICDSVRSVWSVNPLSPGRQVDSWFPGSFEHGDRAMATIGRPPMADMYAHICATFEHLNELHDCLMQLYFLSGRPGEKTRPARIRGLVVEMDLGLSKALRCICEAQIRLEQVGKAPVLTLVQGGRPDA